ncbi:leucine-rich repeat protein soc-2 homolog [Strongylocentrotus purpuratus]|uniref:Uncharacterized protein n=1 Tax=Strongylocentrotus purpuratus TaxID=7668 RepID=A0A7M7GHQ4_STRPU|nr:leucine-rich repeat protein soc-2 homolog [Strongylocentrotus purpuratus]|eukprot:XP_003730013.1 PREDICTED: leucine-rich repeat protein soc-2 homolog [Strongylocentrotus purpuratus]
MAPKRQEHTGQPCFVLFMLIAMLYFAAPENIDICRDCSCFGALQHVSCKGVFRVGAQLKHTFEDVAFRGLDLNIPHSKLSPDLFQNRTGIIYLDLRENGFKFIDDWLFTILRQVKYLTLSHNALTAIPVFHNLTSLQELYLRFNNIRSIGSNLKAHAPKLNGLMLDHNKITFIQGDQFPEKLRTLGLSFNRITSIDRGSLSGLLQLKRVDLTSNLISQISSGSFLLPGLETVILNENRIREIFRDAFNPELDNIYLNNNILSELGNISGIPSLKGLFVSYQSEVIKLQEIPLLENLTELTITVESSPDLSDGIARILTKMPRLQILSVVEGEMDETTVAVYFINISIVEEYNGNRNRVYHTQLRYLHYQKSGLVELPQVFAPLMISLDVSGNLLEELKLKDLTKLYPRLYTLDLSNNRIRVLSSCDVSGVSHPLKVLILKGNNLWLFSAWRCGNGYKILTNLSTLNLDDNRLSYLEREIIPRSSSDQAPFRTFVSAGDSTLICDYHQRWLVKVEDSISFVNTKCSAPEGHAGKRLSDLLKDGFPCPLSVLEEQACAISNTSEILV